MTYNQAFAGSEQVDAGTDETDVDEVSVEAAEEMETLQLVDNCAALSGELAMPGEVDSFRLVADADGRATLNVSELMSDNGTELEVSVLDSQSVEVAKGLTNESVELSFDLEAGGEYVVALSAIGEQTGVYYLSLEIVPDPIDPATVDQHPNEIGEDATLLAVENGVVALDGVLETGEDRDAFRFVSPTDGEIVVAMNAASENFESNTQVTVFDSNGTPVVSGSTNDDVAIRLNAEAGSEYQILVDSSNNLATDFSLSLTQESDLTSEIIEADDGGEVGEVLSGVSEDLLVSEIDQVEEPKGCLQGELGNDLRAEIERIDAAFDSLADSIELELDLFERHLSATQWLPWFMRS